MALPPHVVANVLIIQSLRPIPWPGCSAGSGWASAWPGRTCGPRWGVALLGSAIMVPRAYFYAEAAGGLAGRRSARPFTVALAFAGARQP